MKKKFDKNILLILIPLAILGGIAYMTSRPGGYIREEPHRTLESDWNSSNIYDVKNYSNYSLSKDGDYIIYTIVESSRDRESMRVDTIAQNTKTGDKLILYKGSGSVVDFEINSETNQIAFLTDEAEKRQVYTGQFKDGRITGIRQLTNSTTGVLDWELSKDGSQVAYTQHRRPIEKNGIEVLGRLNQTDLYITDSSSSDRKITESDIVINSMDWSPDGRSIAYEYYASETSGKNDHDRSAREYRTRIREIDITTRTPVDIELSHMGNASPIYSPDGNYIAYTSERDIDLGPLGSKDIKIYNRSTGGVELLMTTPNERPSIEGWINQDEIYISDKDRMLEKLYVHSIGRDVTRELIESHSYHGNFKLDADMGKVYFLDESVDRPIEVYAYSLTDESIEPITDENQRLIEKDLMETELISWNSDGELEIEAIIAYPKDYSPSQDYDLIVNLYGGIDNRFTNGYTNPLLEDYPSTVLQQKGYMVLKVNARGCDGYGPEHRKAVIGDLGKGVRTDIEMGVERLKEIVEAEIASVGILSWGYGSYNLATITGSSDLFDFGVMGASITNIPSFLDTTDRNYVSEIYFGGDALENEGLYIENSPVSRVKETSTPIFMIHGREDSFTLYSQSSIYHNRLMENGIRSDVRIYPRSGHKIEIPRYKTDYIDEMIDWIDNIKR